MVPEGSPPPRVVDAANLDDYVPAPRGGVWEPAVKLGVQVQQGDLLGRLHDFADHAAPPLEIRAHRSGWVLMLHFSARIAQGVTLYVGAREVDL